MEIWLPDVLTLIVCLAGFYHSWQYYRNENYKTALWLLMVCGFVLRLYVASDFYLHEWDERYHALVAKNLMNHPLLPTLWDKPLLPYDFRNWTSNHVWLHKQPLPLWSMALSMKLFGVTELSLRLPSVVISTFAIGLTFYIASFLFDHKTGYIAAFFMAINGLVIELTGGRVATDHIDIFFLFFIELAVFFGVRFVQSGKSIFNVLAGLSLGLAILSKWLPALIVLPIWIFLTFDSGRFKTRNLIIQLLLLTGICVTVFLPWQLYIWQAFPFEAQWESGYNLRHFTEVLEDRSGSVFYFINTIRINYGELIYLPLIWFVWFTFKNPGNLKHWALLIWVIVPLVIFSAAKTKMQGYMLFTSPALFIITAAFYNQISNRPINKKFKWAVQVLLFLLIALPVRYAIERVKPFSKSDRNPDWVIDLKNLNKRQIAQGVLFNYPRPVEAMFYTDITTYPALPEKRVITNLIDEGYYILINNTDSIPDDIRQIAGVELITMK